MAHRPRHWAHDNFQSLSGANATVQARDILTQWRSALGTQPGSMTQARLVVDLDIVAVSTVTDAICAWGVIVGRIGVTPTSNPLGTGSDDYTNWSLWGGATIPAVLSNSDSFLYHRSYDIRTMRKFDASRETLFFCFSTGSGETDNFRFGIATRVLCLD